MFGKKNPGRKALQIFVKRFSPIAEKHGVTVDPGDSNTMIHHEHDKELIAGLLNDVERIAKASASEAGTEYGVHKMERKPTIHVAFGPDAANVRAMAALDEHSGRIIGVSPGFEQRLSNAVGGEALRIKLGEKRSFRERLGSAFNNFRRFLRRG